MLFKILFFVLRLLIALGALAVLAGTLVVFLFDNFVALMKGGASVIAAVVTLFASGFQKSADVPGPSVIVSLGVVAAGIIFLAIFASVFLPTQKIFLHVVAGLSIAAAVWDLHRAYSLPSRETLFMPVLVLWFIYYGTCLWRA